jgi:hypothetical protein
MKQVRVTVKEVHDGIGGVHKMGDTPMLPMDIADALIGLGRCVAHDDTKPSPILPPEPSAADEEAVRALIKSRAEQDLARHDALPKDERIAAYEELPRFMREKKHRR